MRIIENNYRDKEQEYEITCPHCRSKIAYTFDDVVSGGGSEWLYCEACNKEIPLSEDELPTIDTVQYPKHFFSFKNGKPVDDAQITEWTRDCVSKLDKGIDFLYTGTGNACVIAFKGDEDEVVVIATKDYSEASFQIPHEKY